MKYAILLFVFSILLVLLINFLASHFKLLIYKSNLNHKEKFNGIIFNTGGLIFFLFLVFINIFNYKITNIYYYLFLSSIFLIGIFSDIKNINPNYRLLAISFLCVLFINVSNNEILDLKFNIINNFFSNYPVISILFTSLCLIILINGSNFIDGVHGLVLLYGLVVLLFLNYFLIFVLDAEYSIQNGLGLIPVLLILLILNFKEKVFFGDTGSYLLGASIGLYIIKTCNINEYSYPYLYANFLIYPAFEVFFSIFRKLYSGKGPYQPDQKHLHHLVQKFYQNNFNYNITYSKILSAISIIFWIVLFNLLSINFYQEKVLLIINIFIFMIFYSLVYLLLIKKIRK